MRAIEECYLYGILDLGYVTLEDVPTMLDRMIEGGVDIIQLRAKKLYPPRIELLLEQCLSVTKKAGLPLIVNDYPAFSLSTGCEGAHIGQDDGSVAGARQQAGEFACIGKSTHSLLQALATAAEKPDYIGFGPLFPTPTKPDYPAIGLEEIAAVREALPQLPVFCIGGIKLENLTTVLDAGANRVVVVSGILTATDVPAYCRRLREIMGR